MNLSGIQCNQGVDSIFFNDTNATDSKGSTVGQTNKSDTVNISEEAMALFQKNGADEDSGYDSNIVDGKNKDLDSAIALFKEVGFEKYRIIMKTVKQIENALAKAKDDFPEWEKDLENIEKSFADKLPRSVGEAMSRLNKALKDLPEEVRESVLRHLEDEKKKDSLFDEAEADSGLPLALG